MVQKLLHTHPLNVPPKEHCPDEQYVRQEHQFPQGYLHLLHHQPMKTNAQEHKSMLYLMMQRKRMPKPRQYWELPYLQLGDLYGQRCSRIEGGLVSMMAQHRYIHGTSHQHHRCQCGVDHTKICKEGDRNLVAKFHPEKHGEFIFVLWIII